MSDFLSQLDWRFATKQFDATKDLSAETLDSILESIHMAPTSYGLMPFHVVVVKDAAKRQQLREAGYNQPQFEDAPVTLVFCVRNDLKERVEDYIEQVTGGNESAKEAMSGYIDILRGFASSKDQASAEAWAARQAYIALGFAMAACAELQVDSCPMEGFVPTQFDQILELPSHMKSVVALPIGYRAEDPSRPKFRFSKKDLFSEQ